LENNLLFINHIKKLGWLYTNSILISFSISLSKIMDWWTNLFGEKMTKKIGEAS